MDPRSLSRQQRELYNKYISELPSEYNGTPKSVVLATIIQDAHGDEAVVLDQIASWLAGSLELNTWEAASANKPTKKQSYSGRHEGRRSSDRVPSDRARSQSKPGKSNTASAKPSAASTAQQQARAATKPAPARGTSAPAPTRKAPVWGPKGNFAAVMKAKRDANAEAVAPKLAPKKDKKPAPAPAAAAPTATAPAAAAAAAAATAMAPAAAAAPSTTSASASAKPATTPATAAAAAAKPAAAPAAAAAAAAAKPVPAAAAKPAAKSWSDAVKNVKPPAPKVAAPSPAEDAKPAQPATEAAAAPAAAETSAAAAPTDAAAEKSPKKAKKPAKKQASRKAAGAVESKPSQLEESKDLEQAQPAPTQQPAKTAATTAAAPAPAPVPAPAPAPAARAPTTGPLHFGKLASMPAESGFSFGVSHGAVSEPAGDAKFGAEAMDNVSSSDLERQLFEQAAASDAAAAAAAAEAAEAAAKQQAAREPEPAPRRASPAPQRAAEPPVAQHSMPHGLPPMPVHGYHMDHVMPYGADPSAMPQSMPMASSPMGSGSYTPGSDAAYAGHGGMVQGQGMYGMPFPMINQFGYPMMPQYPQYGGPMHPGQSGMASYSAGAPGPQGGMASYAGSGYHMGGQHQAMPGMSMGYPGSMVGMQAHHSVQSNGSRSMRSSPTGSVPGPAGGYGGESMPPGLGAPQHMEMQHHGMPSMAHYQHPGYEQAGWSMASH